ELLAWLPPGEMTGKIHAFDGRVGGGYRMSLFYPAGEHVFRGKTSEREDRLGVQFVGLGPPRRIGEGVAFDTTSPAVIGRDDNGCDFRRRAQRNGSHPHVLESAAGRAGRGQRGRLAVVVGAACPLVRTPRRVIQDSIATHLLLGEAEATSPGPESMHG